MDRFKQVSFRFSVLSIFIILFVITILLIILMETLDYERALKYISTTLLKETSYKVELELLNGIRPAETSVEFSAKLIRDGVISDDPAQLVPYTYYIVKALPVARGAFYGDIQGNQVYAAKEKNGAIRSEIYNRRIIPGTHEVIYRDPNGNIINATISSVLPYDPRVRSWFNKAKLEKRIIWSNVFQFEDEPVLGIVNAAPVFQDGEFQGAFGIDITLNYLSQFISKLKITPNAFAFIITKNEHLIAYPNKSVFERFANQQNKLINVHEVKFPLIDQSIDYYKKSNQSNFKMKYEDETFLFNYYPIPELKDDGWIIVVVIPEADLVGVIQRQNLIVLLVSGLILILCTLLASKIISNLVKPINVLANEATKMKHFDIGKVLSLPSRIKEVILLTSAINSMKLGLKQFQKYLPKHLVEQLILTGQDVRAGGERKELVVLFTDIENFTTISENMDPGTLVKQLCDYFEAIVDIITTDQGTIDKYIGGGLMAFWGAPMHVDNPCYHAARAALRCQKTIATLNAKWAAEGRPIFNTRIGIHTGPAIVGNVGSSERLNYTAMGDTVNLAQRIEFINETYHSKIIVSEAVYNRIKDFFLLKMLGDVVVKGRVEAICIYELLSEYT